MNCYQWKDLQLGMSAQFEVQLTSGMMESFRAISGDVNPLHSDEVFARKAGFTGVVAFGLLTSSLFSRLVGVHLPGIYGYFHGMDVDFVKPAFIGDRLIVHGEIVHLTEAFQRIELKGRITNEPGELITRARLRVGLHEH